MTTVIQRVLTDEQREAVCAQERVCLVSAPAGSGKTEVLIRRIERLLDDSQGKSFRLLAVTFTVKAADELKTRISQSIGEEAWRVDANTIHGFALSWLRHSGLAVGVAPNVVVYAEQLDRMELLCRFLSSVGEIQLQDQVLLGILDRIDELRRSLIKPANTPDESVDGVAFRLQELYEAYTTALDDVGGIDFPGMLTKLFDLFEVDPAVLRRIQRVYRQVLVDEGQDLTEIQAELLNRIVGDTMELFVVADDRQSINGWAGGGIQWAKKLVGPQCQHLELKHNFRCAIRILEVAKKVTKHFDQSVNEVSTPLGAPEGSVEYYVAKDTDEEAHRVADWIEGIVSSGLDPCVLVPGEDRRVMPEEVAVIARTRYALDDVQKSLHERGFRVSVQVDAGSLLSSPMARLFHALMEVQVNHNDRPAWRRVEQELAVIQGEDYVISTEGSNLSDIVKDVSEPSVAKIVELMSHSGQGADSLEGVFDLLQADNFVPLPDLERLLDWWKGYRAQTSRQDRDLTGFLRYLFRVQQARPDQPGIRLMTTHRSKGLEFRVVAIVGLTQGTFPDYRARDRLAIDSERRVFYVSVTRASRALLLTWSRKRRTRYGERLAERSQFLAEVGFD